MEESTEERWVTVAGFPDYEVSDHGRVRHIVSGIEARTKTLTSGYLVAKVGPRYRLVHRLVWESFVGPVWRGRQINHKSYSKTDNHLNNLECVTAKENMQHAIANGHPIGGGERHPKAKLTDAQVLEIRNSYTGALGEVSRLACKYGVKASTIHAILTGRSRVSVKQDRGINIVVGGGPDEGISQDLLFIALDDDTEISIGSWVERPDGLWSLRIRADDIERAYTHGMKRVK